jgi:HK97 family phage major capsid protein
MSSDTLTAPKVTGELTVYYPGEGQAATASDLTLGGLGFVAKKRAIIAHASSELNGDALISFADTLRRGAAFALAAKEDRELVLGDGTSTYGNEVGLLSSIGSASVAQAATGHDLLTELDIGDWTAPMAKLPERHVDARLSWIMSAAVYFGSALRACGGNSQGFDELGRPMFLGYPVNFSIDMPTATAANTVFALFGIFEKCVMIGERTPFALAMSEHAGFATGTFAFRAGSRYDLNVSEAGDSSNAGAFVALKTAS